MANEYFITGRLSENDGLDSSAISPASPVLSFHASRSNLSSKVINVLSTSYADSEIKDALSLLDERGIESDAETRRKIRLDIQKEVIDSNGEIIKEFSLVAERLKRIGHTISNLNHCCEEMRRHIDAANRETAPVLEEVSVSLSHKEQNETKQQLLQVFNMHFIMADDDVAILTSTVEPVNDKFFAVLARAKRLQDDCEILLGAENQSLGLEILNQVSRNLNGAFQKLYRWIQKEFKILNLENPQISTAIRRALKVLAERPSLFQNCLEFFAEAREHILSDTFFTALTGTLISGEEDKSVKPIELVAHDPLRYVGDMLAWVHSAAVSEKEALEVLFISEGDEIAKGIQAGRDNEPWHKHSDGDDVVTNFDGVKALNELVDRDVAGVARVLRQRIEQIIQSHDEIILAFKIANLLNFYSVLFSRLLGQESILLETLASLEKMALRQFRVLLSDHVTAIQGDVQPPTDLRPPDFLQDGLKQLATIMKTYETSFATAETKGQEFETVLADAFDPYMAASSGLAKSLEPPADAIFSINCLLSAKSVLQPFDFTKKRVAAVDGNIEEHAEVLVEDQYAFFLHSSGLLPLLQALEPTPGEPIDLLRIPTLDAFQPQALMDASQILDDFLPSALMDAMENLKQLQNSKLAREVSEKAADRFCEDFETVEEKIVAADKVIETSTDEKDEDTRGAKSLRSLFPRTGGEIRVLLT